MLRAKVMLRPDEVCKTKVVLRQRHLKQRRQMESSLVRDLSCLAQGRVLELPFFARARTIGLYAPVGNEVDTRHLCEEALEGGAVVAYPGVVDQSMKFVRYSADCIWRPGNFGIPVPHGYAECVVAPEEFEVIIVPGATFDHYGNRLGYGKGFYDRYLPQCGSQCVYVGLAYDFQLEDSLPCECHDVSLDYVITDARTIECATARPCLSH